MKKTVSSIVALAAAAVFSTSAHAVVVFGDANVGAPLTGVLNGITQITPANPTGTTSVDVVNDQLAVDDYWSIQGAGGAFAQIVVEIATLAASNTFGIYDKANPTNFVEIFDGASGSGSRTTVSILLDGSVEVGIGNDTGIDFAGNAFGFYLANPTTGFGGPATFYSDSTLNDTGKDHMAAYQGGNGDIIQVGVTAAGPWGSDEYILAWEDIHPSNGFQDDDYTDFVVIIESISPMPIPATLALMGLGLIGFAARRKA